MVPIQSNGCIQKYLFAKPITYLKSGSFAHCKDVFLFLIMVANVVMLGILWRRLVFELNFSIEQKIETIPPFQHNKSFK